MASALGIRATYQQWQATVAIAFLKILRKRAQKSVGRGPLHHLSISFYHAINVLRCSKNTSHNKCESRADINSCLLTAAGTLAVSNEEIRVCHFIHLRV